MSRESRREASRKWRANNKEKHQRAVKDWQKRNPEKVRAISRKAWLSQHYGLTKIQYAQMLEAQNGRCAICKGNESKLQVDHDHDTGAIRALLCRNCNLAIGMLNENRSLLIEIDRFFLKHAAIPKYPPKKTMPIYKPQLDLFPGENKETERQRLLVDYLEKYGTKRLDNGIKTITAWMPDELNEAAVH